MAKTIDDKDLKVVTGGAVDLQQNPSTGTVRPQATKSEGGSTPGGPGVDLDNATEQAPTSGPVGMSQN